MKEYFDISKPGYDQKAASDATSTMAGGPSLTQQHYKDEVDVNTIVRRFGLTGPALTQFSPEGAYGDFTGIQDYEDALARVQAAQNAFQEMPPELRGRFQNDPGRFIDYVSKLEPHEWESIGTPPPPAPAPPTPPAAPVPPAPPTP